MRSGVGIDVIFLSESGFNLMVPYARLSGWDYKKHNGFLMTATDSLIYEQPLNEHLRVCLRLEHLFNQITHWMRGASHWDSRAALTSILETINALDRPDLKTKFVKELGRYVSNLIRFTETPQIDRNKLNAVQNEIEQTIQHLHNIHGRIAQELRDNDFLTTVRQHLLNPGGGCSFDVPAYHYWLQQPVSERSAQLTFWFNHFKIIRDAVELTLHLVRQSSATQTCLAKEGFYQAPLDAQAPCQLIRLTLPASACVYPETSVGRHGLSIRFYAINLAARATQSTEDIKFHLNCCIF
jgi:cell division protein ZapD